MFLRSFLAILCLILTTVTQAAPSANRHVFGSDTSSKTQMPGYCEIEIINQSRDDVIVSGELDNTVSLRPFIIYSYEMPHYISLYYYGYCYLGMFLHIETTRGWTIYDRYTAPGSTLYIRSYQNALTVDLKKSTHNSTEKTESK